MKGKWWGISKFASEVVRQFGWQRHLLVLIKGSWSDRISSGWNTANLLIFQFSVNIWVIIKGVCLLPVIRDWTFSFCRMTTVEAFPCCIHSVEKLSILPNQAWMCTASDLCTSLINRVQYPYSCIRFGNTDSHKRTHNKRDPALSHSHWSNVWLWISTFLEFYCSSKIAKNK